MISARDLDALEHSLALGLDGVQARVKRRISDQLRRAGEGLETTPALAWTIGSEMRPEDPGAGLFDLALWATAIERDAEAEEYLQAAISQQETHIAHLEEALEVQTKGTRVYARQAEVVEARWLLTEMQRCRVSGRVLAEWVAREGVLDHQFEGRKQALGLAEGVLVDAAEAGPDALRRLGAFTWRTLGRPDLADVVEAKSDEEIEYSLRIARALALFDEPELAARSASGRPHAGLGEVPNLLDTLSDGGFGGEQLDRIRVDQFGQERWEEIAFGLAGRRHPVTYGRLSDVEQAFSAARRLVSTSRHIAARQGWSPEEGVCLRISVAPDALADVINRTRGQDGVRAARVVTIRSYGRAVTRNFAVQLQIEAEIDSRPVCLEFQSAITGQTRSRKPQNIAAAAQAAASSAGFAVSDGPVDEVTDSGRIRRFAEGRVDPSAPRPSHPSWVPVLGPDICRHRDASWVPDHSARVLHLNCPSCRRERVAAIPFHRLPRDHEAARSLYASPDAEARYLKHANILGALAGETALATSIDQLRARDGEASLRPADYVVGIRADSERPGRTESIEDVLERRRRRGSA